MPIAHSELILNADGSIYHLNLLPEHIANTIITVGDPERVKDVSKHFDTIRFTKTKREFVTHTGTLNGKELTVISTGIGTDNIDIVFNELDALVNVDFASREVKQQLTSLDIVRIGTSGAIQKNIPVDSFLISEFGIGLDSLLHFYKSEAIQEHEMQDALQKHMLWDTKKSNPYIVSYDASLGAKLTSNQTKLGITATSVGFYGPQSRKIRLDVKDPMQNEKLAAFQYNNKQITNLEMETAGIYGLAKLLGHRAVSMNCILANRATGVFSTTPQQSVEKLITYTLEKLTK
jgi:uridine phosphorylase